MKQDRLLNTITFDGKSDLDSFRLLIIDENTKGIVKNNTLSKQTFNFRGSTQLSRKLSVDGKVSYISSKVKNRPSLAERAANSFERFK